MRNFVSGSRPVPTPTCGSQGMAESSQRVCDGRFRIGRFSAPVGEEISRPRDEIGSHAASWTVPCHSDLPVRHIVPAVGVPFGRVHPRVHLARSRRRSFNSSDEKRVVPKNGELSIDHVPVLGFRPVDCTGLSVDPGADASSRQADAKKISNHGHVNRRVALVQPRRGGPGEAGNFWRQFGTSDADGESDVR